MPKIYLSRIWRLSFAILLSTTCLTANPQQSRPDPARWEKDILAFETALEKNPLSNAPTLFVGSSSFRLWQGLEEEFPELTILKRGFGGAHMSDILFWFDRLIPDSKPQMIVLYAGENDLVAGREPHMVAKDFATFCTKARSALPETPIIFIAVKPSPARWHLQDQIVATNQQVRKICSEDPRLIFVDVATAMLTEAGTPNPALYAPDGIHMTQEGYKLWANLLKPLLQP